MQRVQEGVGILVASSSCWNYNQAKKHTYLHCWRLISKQLWFHVQGYDFMHFYCGRLRWETSLTQNLLIGRLSAAYWSSIQQTTLSLQPTWSLSNLSGIYKSKDVLNLLMLAAENNRLITCAAYPISLRHFNRSHFLMELLVLQRSREAAAAGWLTVLQCWLRFHIETGGGRAVSPPPTPQVAASRAEIYP